MMFQSPSFSVGSTGSNSCSSDDELERFSPGRSKSALARMQTIREKRVKQTSPLISPTPFDRDVFGESPTSLNVWDEDDELLDMTSPRQRNDKTPGNNKSMLDDTSLMMTHHHRRKMEGLRELLAEFDLGA
jgi:hypothetical protein